MLQVCVSMGGWKEIVWYHQ